MKGKNLKMFFSLAPSFVLIFSCYSVEISLYFAGLTISSMSGIQVSGDTWIPEICVRIYYWEGREWCTTGQ